MCILKIIWNLSNLKVIVTLRKQNNKLETTSLKYMYISYNDPRFHIMGTLFKW